MCSLELTLNDLEVVRSVLKEAAAHWFSIGLHVNLSYSTLNLIQKSPTAAVHGLEYCFIEMLAEWLKSGQQKQVQDLKSALELDGYESLASQLVDKLNSRESRG